jgi:hypothetical protein
MILTPIRRNTAHSDDLLCEEMESYVNWRAQSGW